MGGDKSMVWVNICELRTCSSIFRVLRNEEVWSQKLLFKSRILEALA